MAFLVFDKFSSLFGDERGTGLPAITNEEANRPIQFCVLAQFEDENAPSFKQRIDDDEGELDIRGFVKMEIINDSLLQFYVEAANEDAAREEFTYFTTNFGYDTYIDNVTIVG